MEVHRTFGDFRVGEDVVEADQAVRLACELARSRAEDLHPRGVRSSIEVFGHFRTSESGQWRRWATNRGCRNRPIIPFFHPRPAKSRRTDLAAQTPSTALDARGVRFQGKQICQYSKSCLSLHNSQKVCKVLDVMTLGPARAGRPLAADPEVSGSVARWIPLSPGNSRWYFHAVATTRAGKPPRTHARAVATSCGPLVLPARSVERECRNFAYCASHAAAKSSASIWVSDDLAMAR